MRLKPVLFIAVMLVAMYFVTNVHALQNDRLETRLLAEQNAKLLKAAEEGNIAGMRWLLDAGANVDAKDNYGYTDLHGHNYGYTPLHRAAENGYTDVVTLLLSKGADVNAKSKSGGDGWTPLHFAAYAGKTEIAQILIENGANADAKNSIGMTPLHYAASWGKTEVVELLLTKCTDVNNKDDSQDTPLHVAAREGHTEVMKLLLDKGAGVSVNAQNSHGDTPLQCATYSGKPEIVELLLNNDAHVNKISLHHAAQWGYTEVLKLLLPKGADVTAKNERGETPLQLAKNMSVWWTEEEKTRKAKTVDLLSDWIKNHPTHE